jgi:hypothetical protein
MGLFFKDFLKSGSEQPHISESFAPPKNYGREKKSPF